MKLNRMVADQIGWRAGACVAAALLLCGCASSSSSHAEDFDENNSSRTVWQSMDKQAALGARDGASLYANDFDGAELNGLGKAHLDAMMQEHPSPAVVYVNLNPKDSMSVTRRDGVTRYLSQMQAQGMHSPRVEVGANLANGHLASDGLSRMSKTENPSAATEGGGSTVPGTPAVGGGAK